MSHDEAAIDRLTYAMADARHRLHWANYRADNAKHGTDLKFALEDIALYEGRIAYITGLLTQ